MATFRPSGVSISIRQDLTEGSGRSGTTLNCDPIITKDGHRVIMSDIGDICFAKLDQGTDSEEIISFTGITDNTNTYQLTGCVWGYNFYNSTNGVAANQKRHVSGGSLIITNDDHFLSTQYVNTDGDQTFDGVKTFTSFPVGPSAAPTGNYELTNKKYADDLAIAGAPDATTAVKGISTVSVAPVSATAPIAVGDNDGRVIPFAADAEASDTYVITPSPAVAAYATGQSFTFSANTANTGAATLNVNALGAKAILKNADEALEDGDIKAGAIITVIYDGTQFQMQTQQSNMPTTALLTEMGTYFTNNSNLFGGDGSDGALLVSAGTTTLDASNADILIKNYTSIDIQVGTTLTIENPGTNGTILILKSQGDVTIDGTLTVVGMGGAAGTAGFAIMDDDTHFGGDGGNAGASPGAAGAAGAVLTNLYPYTTYIGSIFQNSRIVATGSGGGDGGNGAGGGGGAGGDGGRGGGGLIIECGGSLDFTGIINVSGSDGADGADNTGGQSAAGGGGGACGMGLILYNALTANTGTATAKGGDGGDGGDSTGANGSNDGAGSGGGAGLFAIGAIGVVGGATDGNNGNNGTSGSGASGGSGCGDGAAGGTPETGGTGGTGGTCTTCILIANN